MLNESLLYEKIQSINNIKITIIKENTVIKL